MVVEAEYCWEYKEVASHTRNTCTTYKLMKGSYGETLAPASDYMNLKLNMGTYCGLLWSIFGDHWDYYKELLKKYCILDQKECFTICEAYMPEVCTWITWAIVEDGCSFFGWNPGGV
jgi:hypothetical protein